MHSATSTADGEVRFPSGPDTIRGVLRRASGAPAPGIVLIPDVRGVSELYVEVAAKLAAAGFHTLVLDPYSREGAPDLADMVAVQAWIDALPDERVLGDVAAAAAFLGDRPEVQTSKLGVVGFCLGGQYAFMAACRPTGFGACVGFYGMLRHARTAPQKAAPPLEVAAAVRCPVLGLFGAEDPLIPLDDVREFERRLRAAGAAIEVRIFEGAGHAFANDRRPETYRPGAAAEAFALAINFLQQHLS